MNWKLSVEYQSLGYSEFFDTQEELLEAFPSDWREIKSISIEYCGDWEDEYQV